MNSLSLQSCLFSAVKMTLNPPLPREALLGLCIVFSKTFSEIKEDKKDENNNIDNKQE